MALGFGHRARVGQLYPSGGLCDYELQMMAPAGVQVVTTRMPFAATSAADDLAMIRDLERNALLLADAEVDLIAFNCTAASLLAGPEVVTARITAATGISAVTTIDAVEQALLALDARRIALVNPYPPEVEEHEISYLADHGFTVVATAGPACATPTEQGAIPHDTWRREVGGLDPAAIDAVLISCAGVQTAEIIGELEDLCGLPVVTSNQALLRLVLLHLGLEPVSPDYGRLLAARAAALPATEVVR
ncbi:maleate cis-trans isomerase family protein [Nocardioides massiliensis]|uniref:Maleate isomerase n=1 Tax=Nocardioides massiliensis TaxID=1325935 RepID=A0ABT9NNE3_9ACTN|nr:aspartate/glutamate racemase family protein [Nocardioides massiliensis]MDP9821836.1 maleate isomerase [Nocardioides massiliensis]